VHNAHGRARDPRLHRSQQRCRRRRRSPERDWALPLPKSPRRRGSTGGGINGRDYLPPFHHDLSGVSAAPRLQSAPRNIAVQSVRDL